MACLCMIHSTIKLLSMKRILTLLIGLGAISATYAQTPQEEARRVILNGGKDKKTDRDTRNSRDVVIGGDRDIYGNYPAGSREAEIDRINRDYDARIESVRNDRRLSNEEKERAIRQLNNERARAIRQVNNERRDRREDDNDRDREYKKDKKYKSNNGNHYGWEKGKGNPHRNGGKPGKGKGKSNKGRD